MSAVLMATGGPTASQKYVTMLPREYNPNGTKRWIIYLHYAGTDAYGMFGSTGYGVLKLLQGLSQWFPILVIDGGTIPGSGTDDGQRTFGNATAIARIADAVAWVIDPTKGGGKTDKVILMGASQGVPGIINYAKANPTKVAALVGVLPVSDLDDVRNYNRPLGWTGTTPNAPASTDYINAAYGLALGSTADYPTHGASLVALPAGANPATADLSALSGIPVKAWRSPSDTTVPTATVTALFSTKLGGTIADISPDSGHVDASVGAVPPADVAAFIQPYAA